MPVVKQRHINVRITSDFLKKADVNAENLNIR